jgi:enoyl-CoA hydratase/carnithine racemase
MGLPETSLGILPGYGGTQRMARLIGKAKTYELVLSADKGLTAAEALRLGLINRILPAGHTLAGALELAGKIAANGPAAVRYAMAAIRDGVEMPFAQGLEFEATLFGLCAATEDMREGMAAFLEKRPPRFTGH